jgi:hypothetical protein
MFEGLDEVIDSVYSQRYFIQARLILDSLLYFSCSSLQPLVLLHSPLLYDHGERIALKLVSQLNQVTPQIDTRKRAACVW